MFENLKLQGKDLIIVILILLLAGAGYFYFNNNGNWNAKWTAQLKLEEALRDSVRTYKNTWGEEVAEKLTLQGTIGDLVEQKDKMSTDQKLLIDRVQKLNKEKNLISAALIRQGVKVDSLSNIVASVAEVDIENATVAFVENDSTSDFQYDLLVSNVLPSSDALPPKLTFRNLYFPNLQTVSFQWDENDRKDFPVSFSVSNSNKYYQTYNIESFAIEGLRKELVDPTGWQKIGNFFKINGKYFLVGAGGFGLGVLMSQ